jgi:hypothetical protein
VIAKGWDFDFAPIAIGGGDLDQPDADLVIATETDVDAARVAELLRSLAPRIEVSCLFSVHPLYWTRVQASQLVDRQEVAARLREGGLRVRYVTSARYGSQVLPPPLDFGDARPRKANDWSAREPRDLMERNTPWRWFLREHGVNVVRPVCGTGAGTRLALIDNDGGDLHHVALDAELPIMVESIARATNHAALLLGWCVGARTPSAEFHGVAPDASPRFYCIPKPSAEIVSLPLAIARAADDGADVIVCATFVDGQTSPLLDDALEVAVRMGRGGRGAVVVFPTSRQVSSPRASRHSSLSLGLFDPASDPRVVCVGPSARDGRWFLWRDRRGKLRPFANRSPALRFLAPGDDLAYPFADDDRPAHAESSGASAVAAGVALLTLANNPELSLPELHVALTETASTVDASAQVDDPALGDRFDLMPRETDPDGHNAKHGYGRLNATRATLVVSDPVSACLSRIGEDDAAARYLAFRRDGSGSGLYSERTATWAARVLLRERQATHVFAALCRAARLFHAHPEHLPEQPPGHLLRQIALALRALLLAHPPDGVLEELERLERRVRELLTHQPATAGMERVIANTIGLLWPGPETGEPTLELERPREQPSERRSEAQLTRT